MRKEEFINKCKENGLEITTEMMNKFDTYASFLVEYNEKINLTAITEYEDILEKHFYDSLLLSFNNNIHGTLADIGTGAGFPGVVLKIAYPDLKVILIEPLKKRCVFLEELINKLELKDIKIINERSEDLKIREQYNYVTARAVTNLSNLIEISGALVKVNGYFIALRGSSGIEEIENSQKAIKEMGFEVEKTDIFHLTDESKRVISFFIKKAKTDKKYPRKYSIIKQRPL